MTAALILATALMYGRGTFVLWERAGARSGISRTAFGAGLFGLGLILLALTEPVATLSEERLSVHMLQHALLMAFAPPLLVYGRMGTAIWWALPGRAHLSRSPAVHSAGRAFGRMQRPLVAGAIYAATLWIWHIPLLYEAALRHESIHVLEHVSFVVAAMLFWSSITAESAVSAAAAAVVLFITALHAGGLGALLATSSRIWYGSYAAHAHDLHATLDDQHRAGVLMWIPLGFPYIAAGLLMVALVVRRAGRRGRVSRADAVRHGEVRDLPW
jgi:putative membrane protein